MAEKIKKAKAPAKLRTSTASVKTTVVKAAAVGVVKAVAVGKPVTAKTPSHDEIAHLAYEYWLKRERKNGQHQQDWLRAERELKGA
jgi:hypothetical protein